MITMKMINDHYDTNYHHHQAKQIKGEHGFFNKIPIIEPDPHYFDSSTQLSIKQR